VPSIYVVVARTHVHEIAAEEDEPAMEAVA